MKYVLGVIVLILFLVAATQFRVQEVCFIGHVMMAGRMTVGGVQTHGMFLYAHGPGDSIPPLPHVRVCTRIVTR